MEMDCDDRTRDLTNVSVEEERKLSKFMKVLIGKKEAIGILRERRKSGRCHVPLMHQRKAVKFMISPKQRRSVLVHDPGMGKTYTLLLLIAALYVIHPRSKSELKFLISTPTSCLDQWLQEVMQSLNIPAKFILATTKLEKLTKHNIAAHSIIIVSRETIGRAYSTCYEHVSAHHVNENNRWVSQWDRIQETDVHPLFDHKFSLFGIDELHFLRNPLCAWTKGHELLSRNSLKSVGLSATPVFNSPKDLYGISTAMDLRPELKKSTEWFVDKDKSRVNTNTIRAFNHEYVHRADDSILNLPPITHEYINFDVSIPPERVSDYNDILLRARQIRFRMQQDGRAAGKDNKKLENYLLTMQQFLVSPLLATMGAAQLKAQPGLILEAASEDTGALRALHDQILKLKAHGHKRIMIAACHTTLLNVAKVYLEKRCPEGMKFIAYDGTLSHAKRILAINDFLHGEVSKNEIFILGMSILAGGTGTNLVPGANAVIFFGSRPFSPMQVIQTSKRVHRIGQEHPVLIVHLVANGSVDYAINLIHGDKLTLSNAVIDMDMMNIEADGGKWRTTGRIVDGCRFLNEAGIFPDVHITEAEAIRMSEKQATLALGQTGTSCDSNVLRGLRDAIDTDPEMPPFPFAVSQALASNATRTPQPRFSMDNVISLQPVLAKYGSGM